MKNQRSFFTFIKRNCFQIENFFNTRFTWVSFVCFFSHVFNSCALRNSRNKYRIFDKKDFRKNVLFSILVLEYDKLTENSHINRIPLTCDFGCKEPLETGGIPLNLEKCVLFQGKTFWIGK